MSDFANPLSELGGPAGFTEFIDSADTYWEQYAPPLGASLANVMCLDEEQASRDAEEEFLTLEWKPPFSVSIWGIPVGPPTPVPGVSAFQKFVIADSRADQRSRAHETHVAAILNSLMLKGVIRQIAPKDYILGYTPDEIQDWQPGAPATLQEALDRIAAALKAAGFTP